MRVGIYCGNTIPEDGGANSLINTIINELKHINIKHKYVFLFSDPSEKKIIVQRDEYKCINVHKIVSTSQKLKFRLMKIGMMNYMKYSRYDIVAKYAKLDLIWFVHPTDADISVPYIYTVWDLGHRVVPFFPEVSIHGEWQAREKMYSKMIPGASYVVTGNETGKKEILSYYKVDSNKIYTIPFPIASFCFGEEEKPEIIKTNAFYFYPAQFWAHKNHIRILEAVKLLKEEGINIVVYFTGSDKGNKTYIENQIKLMGLENNIIITGFLSYEELKYMYTHAKAMIFASLMGPNNMPPIEATYLGCKVIITDIEGHKEQMGDAALYFNGYNSKELADVIKKIETNDYDIDKLENASRELAEQFKNVNYTKNILKILDDFEKKRKCWK